MADPFFRGFDRTDFIFLASAAKALAEDDFSELEKIFGAFGPGVVSHRKGSGIVPDAYLYISDTYIIVLIQGTEGTVQWVSQILGSVFAPISGFGSPGVTGFDAIVAATIFGDINPVLAPRVGTRSVVFMGFSLGGALAQCVAWRYRNTAQRLSVLTIGAPRVGSPQFASDMGSFVLRLSADRDPIPSVPPPVWQPLKNHFPIPGITGPTLHYEHAGQGSMLHSGGDIVAGDDLLGTDEAAAQLASGSAPTHSTSWYLSQLLVQSNLSTLPAPSEGYTSPPALYQATRVLQGLPPASPNFGGVTMADTLIQGVMYFRDNGVSEGFSETVYTISDIGRNQTMLASLIPIRAQFLAKDLEIHAYRSAQVGDTKRSQVTKMASPQKGQTSNPCNEVGDAILYLYKSAVNAKRILTYRGIPDDAIEANALTANGRALLAQIDAYGVALLANGVGIKVPSPFNLVQTIAGIANVVPGGPIGVTSDLAHGLDTNDVVNIAGIRLFPYLLGKWKVRVTSPTTFTLRGSERYNISLGAGGTFQQITYALQAATSQSFDMVSFRKTGRPFGQPIGKRSKRLLRS